MDIKNEEDYQKAIKSAHDSLNEVVQKYMKKRGVRQNEMFRTKKEDPDHHGCGVSQQSWISWRDSGRDGGRITLPSGEAIIRMCKYLELTPNELLGYDDPEIDAMSQAVLDKEVLHKKPKVDKQATIELMKTLLDLMDEE